MKKILTKKHAIFMLFNIYVYMGCIFKILNIKYVIKTAVLINIVEKVDEFLLL